jgi:hypothetical protein
MTRLNPADMEAVLARTNLAPSQENLLLPIYEAVSNSIYACQERWGDSANQFGKIQLDISTSPFSATITDNGVGLTQDHFEYFCTPFTGTKLKKGGKGFGRFIAFKVFDQITYHSRQLDQPGTRSFRFDIYRDEELEDIEPGAPFPFDTGCAVQLEGVKAGFSRIPQSIGDEEYADRIIRYFLPFFLRGEMPLLTLSVDSTKYDASAHSARFFPSTASTPEVVIVQGESHDMQISISKVEKGRLFDEHMMLMFADGRIIGAGRSIERKIGSSHFETKFGEKQVYVAAVSGTFFDSRANTARTQIEASEAEIDDIANYVVDMILSAEAAYVERHRRDQVVQATTAITRNPLLLTALRGQSVSDYVSTKPMSWKAENFVADLALVRFREQTRWDRVFDAGLKAPQQLKDMREELVRHLDNESKDALAAYVSHRKSVLDLADAVLGYQSDGRMSLEDVFHDLIHPRYEDSDSTKFYQHNLWLIDDRLAFFSYLSSDRTMHGGRRHKGDKVADLVIFDDCSIYAEADQSTLVLVELKRPGRNDYRFGVSGSDPVQQVLETALKIREDKRLVTTSGRTISIPTGTRIFSYVVADLEPSLVDVCENHDMARTWDERGFYRYHEKRDVFIEVAGYDKIVSDARKRNAAFFEVLLGDVVS